MQPSDNLSGNSNDSPPQLSVRDLVLLRISAGSATRADLQRDVAPLLAPRIPGVEFRRSAELAISTLTGSQLVTEAKGRLTASGKGMQVAEALLASAKTHCATWRDVRTALVIRAVQANDTPAIRKALQRAEGLAALVLQHHFGKSTARVQSPADLRSDLAIIALERAFGNKIKTGFKKGAGLPAKPGRVLAGQLFRQPREIASDGKLILHLACEVAGSRDHSLDSLELAVLRGLAIPNEPDETPSPPTQRAPRSEPAQRTLPLSPPAPNAANDRLPISEVAPPRLRAPSPPDMAEFCQAVIDAARPVSEGWPGNRKAFISLVWKAIRNTRPDWGLSEIAFKGMLAEAHRSGQVELATADLKDGRDLQSLEDSKILYKKHRLALRARPRIKGILFEMGVEGGPLTKTSFAPSLAPDKLSEAFEHSITWEDDLWRADPVDVPEIHAKARQKFNDLLTTVTSGRGYHTPERILLFHGQSGAGKTHLLRALRTDSHRTGQSYFGYAQMTPDVQNYAEFYLRRLVHSLEKPYDPDRFGESALSRLTNRMVLDSEVISSSDLDKLRDATLDDKQLARLILRLADQIVACEKFQTRELDINIVRALLYLQRRDPRIDQRIRQYLNGRQLTAIAHEAVSALDPNDGEDRAFEIIAAIGALVWTVERAALVFCIDQVEDLRFFDNAEDRFQRAVRDLIQIANRLTNAIIIISCLEDFYGQVRGLVAQSYIDRIEKSGPVLLRESRTPEEARLIISKRLAHHSEVNGGGLSFPDASQFFGPQFFEEFGGLSTRRLLEHAQSRLREATSTEGDEREPEEERPSFISTLAQALGAAIGFGGDDETPTISAVQFREMWERFANESEAEMPADDQELVDILAAALHLARDEWVAPSK